VPFIAAHHSQNCGAQVLEQRGAIFKTEIKHIWAHRHGLVCGDMKLLQVRLLLCEQ
jgi:hypothetical protein